MTTGEHQPKVRVEALTSFCIRAMRAAGLPEEHARTSAEVLVTTDTWGTYTHGTKQLRGLLKNFRDGTMDLHGETELIAEGPSWARFDGHRAMPMVTSTLAMRTAMDKARTTGTAAVGVCNSGHFGAAGYYANLAALGNMIGLSMCNVDPGVAAPGSRVPVLGTNPLSYAAPAGDGTTVFLDIATSVVAAGKVYAAQAAGTGIPEGWLIDKDGLPTTDPRGYPQAGALLPMAGHKGYGIALMIEILTGVLNGGAFGREVVSWVKDGKPVNQSFSFVVIDIAAFMPVDRFIGRMKDLAREIHDAPKARGAERIYLPGEKEWENRAHALREGLPLPPDVVANLEGVARDYSLDPSQLYAS